MVKSELNKRSPLRIFEKSIHGGLGKGNIGILASRKGVGKTACLVHIATDKLFRDKHVIHVSFSARVDHIVNWYEDIFKEIAKKRNLEDAVEIHDELIKHRVIMNFNQEGINPDQILKSIKALIVDGQFKADSIIFDGFDFEQAKQDDINKISEFAKENELEIWFSVSLKGKDPVYDDKGYPLLLKPFNESIDVLIGLKYNNDHVGLSVIKDRETTELHEMHLKLDPKTMLIAEE